MPKATFPTLENPLLRGLRNVIIQRFLNISNNCFQFNLPQAKPPRCDNTSAAIREPLFIALIISPSTAYEAIKPA